MPIQRAEFALFVLKESGGMVLWGMTQIFRRLAIIKRVMYGRCGFEPLRFKTILLEHKKFVN
jgi:hypothetical protein